MTRYEKQAAYEANLALLEQLRACLAAPGDHHHLVRMRLVGVLIEAAELAGDRESARALAMQKTELARAHDAAHRSRP